MAIPNTSPTDFTKTKFDYLIIGGGTAGLALAARLSANASISVGVLEAGPAVAAQDDLKLLIDVPGRFGEAIGSVYDWQFGTTAQPGLGGRELAWPRGKVLGGSSALNFMTWNRPGRDDLDAWEALGNRGWGWDAFLPFYKKSERFIVPDSAQQQEHGIYFDEEAMGVDGPLAISFNKDYSVSHRYWHETLNQLGVPTNKSHLSGSNVGVWTSAVAVDPETCTRTYSAPSYYHPIAERSNLMVLTDALVREIVIGRVGSDWTARAVRFSHVNTEYTVEASHEVILSAGSIASPQLLELSGIGDPAVLEAAGIAVKVANSNVGENLQDHLLTATIYEVDPSIPSPDDLRNDSTAATAADEAYLNGKTGPRTILACSLCYLPLYHFVPPETLDELASRAIASASSLPLSPPKREILARRLSEAQQVGQIEYIFDIGNWNPALHPEPGRKYATMLQILQYPFSVGSIHIPPKSADMQATIVDTKPIIDPKYYFGPNGALDLEVMRLCAEHGDKIARTPPLSGLIKRRVWPPDSASSTTDWTGWVRENTTTDWHPVGTCSMGGAEGAAAGVVDERLRVYGVRGLRVVDASVMPLQISAHLQATVYAIAEKAAAMILEDRDRVA